MIATAVLTAWSTAFFIGQQAPDPTAIEQTNPTAEASSVRWTRARLRLAAGSELDTNARRAIQGADVEGDTVAFRDANRPFEVVSDGLARVVIESEAGLILNDNHALRGHYVLGAKRFFTETTEDLLVQELGLASLSFPDL
ncbi:MAG: hypothetical protein AAF449_22230, partial [Myxococcota bacterium]